jgi:tripartite-type tricarboxylate transporter receptor subunit TctC
MTRPIIALTLALASLAALPLGAQAQDYPTRPIRLVVPFPPGGPTDVLARIVATRLGERLKQAVVIDNKPGASGMVGADMVAKAAPDGYTLLANASIHVINPSLYAKTAYDAIADFAPVSNLADVPLVLAVHPKLEARSVNELVALGKSSKTSLAFASADNATSQPPKRSAALPDVPTVAESGYPGFAISTWYGVWAPAATPPALVQRLSREIAAIVRLPEVREQFAGLGAEPVGNTPEEFSAFTKAELAKWARIVKRSGAKID